VPAAGGTPQRVTWHPGDDRLLDWTPDGKQLLFASGRSHGVRVNQFFRVAPSGGLPQKLPVPYGEFGALAADGRRIAYTTKAREFRTWKRYRGGLAPDIWLFDLESLEARNLTANDANDLQPMWHGDRLYFLSDRGPHQRYNVWVLDRPGSEPRQVTHFTDTDITFPAIGPQEIVFETGGRLYLLDLASEAVREVEVEVVTDLATLRPREVEVGRLIQGANISPTGARALFEARGEVFTVPAEHGIVRRLGQGSASAERFPAWSPDGARVAYWSDALGEYELTIEDARGGDPQTLTELGPGFRYRLFWSPDSRKIAFIDNTQTIRCIDVDSKAVTEVGQLRHWLHPALLEFELSWSPDSRWIAYARDLESEQEAIVLFDTAAGTSQQVTSGFYSDSGPVFDPGGEYLYYRSNRSLEPVSSDLDSTWVYPNTAVLVAVPLRKDVAAPLPPRNDEEGAEEPDEADRKSEGAEGAGKKNKAGKGKDGGEPEEEAGEKPPEPVEIDLEDFEARAVVLPPAPGNYGKLRAVSGKLVFHRAPRTGSADETSPIVLFDFETREEQTVLDNADAFELSADGKKLLVAVDGGWAIVDLAPGAKIEDRLPTGSLRMLVDPRAEWHQMFDDVWRTYRDNFYDPGMHGLDWDAVGRRYRALLDDAVTRWDVDFVMGELVGELNASHTYIFGGDMEQAPRLPVGLLGIDWELDGNAYRVARIVRGASWDAESRSPLLRPGVGVSEGDYILAVNGVPLDPGREPWAALAGLAGETVELTVNDRPALDGSRRVLVETLDDDRRLRQLEWIEANRKRVAEATDGRVGYVYVPNTGVSGQTELVRQYVSQVTTEGLIVDERWNAGGQLPDRFVELMNRQRVTYISFRYGGPVPHPWPSHIGPKVMLINGWAGSGGDAFPFFFREMDAGPLIGERTWGGLIGPAFAHVLVDGGVFTAPPGRLYGPDGTWFAEGHGVDPDIPVVDDPALLARGRDPQLEAAIAEVLRRIAAQPPRFMPPPPFEPRIAQPR